MAQAAQLNLPRWMQMLGRYSNLVVPLAMVSLLGVIIVPLPPVIMDLLIASNLSLAAVVLLTTTLFRLVLNVASTRLILSADAAGPSQVTDVAGKVIETFGTFVTGGAAGEANVVVGIIIFVILIVVQFVVITKGSTRISEVAARFTLDGMPGKQMAIDADLNAGIIDEHEARRRRETITREADFYGAMDGASKFVRGDAIAGVIITVINIVGGFAIGVFEKGWPVGDTMAAFTKLTIGDGLVSQIPAFIIAIAAGLIVTRSSSERDLGQEFTTQLVSSPVALAITAGFLGLMAFTGLPAVPMLGLAASVGGLAWLIRRRTHYQHQAEHEAQQAEQRKQEGPPPVEKLLNVDTMELEVGYGLVKLVDQSQGGDLLDRISMMRRQLAVELGLIVPPVRIRDNMQVQPHEYRIKVRGNTIGQGEVYPDQYLAMDSGIAGGPIQGQKTREPAFGLDAYWIDEGQRSAAETMNYTVVDASSVLATHLTELIKTHAEELLTREETTRLIEQLREKSPKLVEEVIGNQIKTGELQKVLQGLLRERVPIRDMETIIETLAEWSARTKDLDVLVEYVRNALRRTICNQYVEADVETGASRLYCVSLDPGLEDMINGYIERGQHGTSMSMPPGVANRITTAVLTEMRKLIESGHHPVVLSSPQVRAQVRQLLESHLSNVAVLGYNEVSKGVEVESMGLVQLPSAPDQAELEGAVN